MAQAVLYHFSSERRNQVEMKQIMKWIGALLLLLMFVWMKQSSVAAGELNFTVEPIFPENQINKNAPYFDLRVTPGQKQEIEVEITNASDKEVNVLIYATTAKTNANGIIEYKDLKKNYDATLKAPFSEIATVPNRIVLKGKETTRIKVAISVPDEPFSGMILGGLYFKEESPEEQDNDGKGMEVQNTFSYVITVKLTENDDPVEQQLKLLKVKPTHFNGNNVLEVDLQNSEPVDVSQLKLTGEVHKKGSSKILYTEERAGLRLAPNSTFGYMIPLEGKAFVPGKYELELHAVTDENEWNFTQEFEITKEQADKLNQTAVGEIDYQKNNWPLIIGGVVAIGCVLGFVSIKMKKNQQKTLSKPRKKKKISKKKKNRL